MTLDEFLKKHKGKVTACDLAQAINRTESYISKLRRFYFVPSLPIIHAICEFSNRQITPKELVKDVKLKGVLNSCFEND
jgi:hypothetical protein